MPSITPRKNKDGDIISYTIRVYHGYDGKGKRLNNANNLRVIVIVPRLKTQVEFQRK